MSDELEVQGSRLKLLAFLSLLDHPMAASDRDALNRCGICGPVMRILRR